MNIIIIILIIVVIWLIATSNQQENFDYLICDEIYGNINYDYCKERERMQKER